MREAFEDGGDTPGMKSPLTAMAAPRAQAGRGEHEVENSVAVRAKTIVTAALRTDHRHSESVAQDTEKPVGGQAGEDTEARGIGNPQQNRRNEAEAQRSPSGMDNPAPLSDNFAQSMRQPPRPRRLNEFDPEYAR